MIREAVPGDAASLAGVHLRAWHRAYADFVDPERFGTLEERVVRWEEILAQPPELVRTTLVHDLDGQVSGFATVGPARDTDLPPTAGELMALYVDPPAQGAGVGGHLHDAALGRLRSRGFQEGVLWVFEANGHARHVYERRGWVLEAPERTRHLEGPDWWAPAVRYRREL